MKLVLYTVFSWQYVCFILCGGYILIFSLIIFLGWEFSPSLVDSACLPVCQQHLLCLLPTVPPLLFFMHSISIRPCSKDKLLI